MKKLILLLIAISYVLFNTNVEAASGAAEETAPTGKFAILGCGTSVPAELTKEDCCMMEGKPGYSHGAHEHEGVFTININPAYTPTLVADICREEGFPDLAARFDVVYNELIGIDAISKLQTHRNGLAMVAPGGYYIVDGVGFYSFTALHKDFSSPSVATVFDEEEDGTLTYTGETILSRKFKKGKLHWPASVYRAESPFEGIITFAGLQSIDFTEERTLMAKDWLAEGLGITEASIFAGTVDGLTEQEIDIRGILGPLGVAPLPRWDGQTFVVIRKPIEEEAAAEEKADA
jgi:hypothetical protein